MLCKEASFVLFAEGSAAKEQWYTALRHASSGRSTSAVEDAYAQFCLQVREGRRHIDDYPQVRSDFTVAVKISICVRDMQDNFCRCLLLLIYQVSLVNA